MFDLEVWNYPVDNEDKKEEDQKVLCMKEHGFLSLNFPFSEAKCQVVSAFQGNALEIKKRSEDHFDSSQKNSI